MRTVVGTFLLLMVAACALGDPRDSAIARGRAATATLDIWASGATSQTSAREWSLAKTGAVDATTQTVTWTITATETTTTANQLVVSGCMTLEGDGAGAATLGNVVVNLQTRANHAWATQSTDIANATAGDAATSAAIAPHASSEGKSSFATNAASGKLEFTSPCGGAAYSLSPEHTIAADATLALGYSATFDNNVLGLAAGTPIRVEIIATSGNAPANGPSAANVDINGNGVIDPDEAYVRSVPARLGLAVPAATIVTSTPTIVDSTANITTTGTVTYSNAVFSIGATSGTATASWNGGAQGGTIENCATLTGQGLANVSACDTETIPRTAWQDGQIVTYDQGLWGGLVTNPGAVLLLADFSSVYAATSGLLTLGSTTGFTMIFSTPVAVIGYLPAPGTAAALDQNLVNPSSSSSGTFGGDVTALQLDVDFADAGVLTGTSTLRFGDLAVCNLTSATDLDGLTVRQILAVANTALAGGTTTDSIADLDSLVAALTLAFASGSPSAFAQQSLFAGSCP